jgi:hypothetical protein
MTHANYNPPSYAAAREAHLAYVPLWRDIRVLNALLGLGAIALFAGYLALNNSATEKGFAIRGMERRINELQNQRQKLDLSVVTDESMDSLDGKIQGLGLVPVTEVDYLNGGSGAVAVR